MCAPCVTVSSNGARVEGDRLYRAVFCKASLLFFFAGLQDVCAELGLLFDSEEHFCEQEREEEGRTCSVIACLGWRAPESMIRLSIIAEYV